MNYLNIIIGWNKANELNYRVIHSVLYHNFTSLLLPGKAGNMQGILHFIPIYTVNISYIFSVFHEPQFIIHKISITHPPLQTIII